MKLKHIATTQLPKAAMRRKISNNTKLSGNDIINIGNNKSRNVSIATILMIIFMCAAIRNIRKSLLFSIEKFDEKPFYKQYESIEVGQRIMLVVMGEKESFSSWTKELSEITNISLSFMYGSFDEEISPDECDSLNDESNKVDCSTRYIPNTTWTQGRNRLASEVVKREIAERKKYDWWIFSDDDFDPVCANETYFMDTVLGKDRSCWQKILNFVTSEQVPEKVTTLTVPMGIERKGYVCTSQVDAIFAAFKRTYVPYLLPYATLEDGISQWLSQSVNFCIMETCFERSTLVIPYVFTNNKYHREYVREDGFTIENFHKTIKSNFYDYATSFQPCKDKVQQSHQYEDVSELVATKEELDELIPDHKLSHCESLVHRFRRWEEKVNATSFMYNWNSSM